MNSTDKLFLTYLLLCFLSVYRTEDGRIGGYIRIRSKTQGIALALGDKITLRQKQT